MLTEINLPLPFFFLYISLHTDDWVGTVLLMILFVLITLLIGLIVSYFYCRDNSRSEMCAELKGDLTYWYMRIQYTYRYYTGSGRK